MTLTEGIFCYICVTALLDAALPFTFIKSKSLSLILNQMTLTADICLLHLRTALIRSPSPLLSPFIVTFTKPESLSLHPSPLLSPFIFTFNEPETLSLNPNHFH